MNTLTCIDLDRTVIYSPGALQLPMPDTHAPRLLCVEVYQGAPLSFVTERAGQLLVELAAMTTLVPTTTRTPEQLARVHLPGLGAAKQGEHSYAIASNGGYLLVDGEPDPAWTAEVSRRLRHCAPVEEVHEHVRSVARDEFLLNLRVASGLFVYAVVERAELPTGWVQDLTAFCDVRGWGVSVQGRKVYCVPRPLTKTAAVQEIGRRLGGGPNVLAAGDSLLDAEMLANADAGVRPSGGELADTGWNAPHVHCVPGPGVIGGEQLVAWLVDRIKAGCR